MKHKEMQIYKFQCKESKFYRFEAKRNVEFTGFSANNQKFKNMKRKEIHN